jgi:hypothetical protein
MANEASKRTSLAWFAAIIGGLLSSNCCALQLILNFMGFGCAGFAMLSPFRLALFLVALVVLMKLMNPGLSFKGVAQATTFIFLVCLPELISLNSQHGALFLTENSIENSASIPLFARVEGMKCAACGDRARAISLSVPCVQNSAVYWEKHYMKLHVHGGSDVNQCGHSVSTLLKRAGFHVSSLELCSTSTDKPSSFPFSWSAISPRHRDVLLTGNCSLFV